MAKKSDSVEFVWLQCGDCGSLNYRTPVNVKGGLPEKLKEGMKKYCPKTRTHTVHKIKRK
jgi:large subunit ribosomal protein L33